MAELEPFRALCFGPEAPRVPGGDRVDTGPLVTPDVADAGTSYRTARETLERWQRGGWIRPDTQARLWVLEIREPCGRCPPQVGVLGAARLDDDVVVHEDTHDALVGERAARLAQVPVDVSPIMLYPVTGLDAVQETVEAARRHPPQLERCDELGVRFRLWALPAATAVQASVRTTRLVVADGHHRVAAARRIATSGPAHSLAYLLPRPPTSGAVHRLVHARDGRDLDEALTRAFAVREPVTDAAQVAAHLRKWHGAAYAVFTEPRRGVIVVPRDLAAVDARVRADRSPEWRRLDAVRWRYGLRPMLGDVEVRPVHDLEAALGTLSPALPTASVVVVFRPVDTPVVTRLAVNGEPLPPKVTWFAPKPRTGLLARAAA